ncbi:DUF1769-domain-containing protein [Dissoconium aciculare CBS 342.82]|uniref:DUF1769-domain-containing protein n=1 Tax=Dissoconium aciculare CBS 342.82 TaxID=1314786 RepID=A0A6J3MI40_9PEZI|nr:DUF1769-domain-containing protein [Dissoconium aciculare CBS 342.82]KAF1827580.1 DUF1769-domain-containing protein [Dissoconium aciculare CBS 342.82]
MSDKYTLSVTAGPSYKDQKPVPVNTEDVTKIDSDLATINLRVRIQNFRGESPSAPKTSPYFEDEHHKSDLYSLGFTLTPKKDINGNDLVLGNDFDHPIRDRLPPGFQQAFKIATWFIDPGLYGDVHADEPYLYSPLLSSINVLRIGPKDDKEQEKIEEARAEKTAVVFEEGADGDGQQARESQGVPATVAARRKHFLTKAHLEAFTLEKDREYSLDFYNPYLDFNGKTHSLRYVLKNRETDETLFVVVFSLVPKDGHEKPEPTKETAPAAAPSTNDDDVD